MAIIELSPDQLKRMEFLVQARIARLTRDELDEMERAQLTPEQTLETDIELLYKVTEVMKEMKNVRK